MNIAKWIYFFLVIKTHRSIREHEIEVELMDEEKHSEQAVSKIENNIEIIDVDENLLTDSINRSNRIK